MISPPRTRKEAEAYRYGYYRTIDFQPQRCAYQVNLSFYLRGQCLRKPGHGPDKLYCKQHARKVESK